MDGDATVALKYLGDIYYFSPFQLFYNIVFSFVLGLVFSPFSSGGKFFIFFLLSDQILFAYATKFDPRYWRVEILATHICCSFLGYVLGRTFAGYKNPFFQELSNSEKERQRIALKQKLFHS